MVNVILSNTEKYQRKNVCRPQMKKVARVTDSRIPHHQKKKLIKDYAHKDVQKLLLQKKYLRLKHIVHKLNQYLFHMKKQVVHKLFHHHLIYIKKQVIHNRYHRFHMKIFKNEYSKKYSP
ncbi:uncharacterized protein LOC116179716 [Photinus pyralis]|uniref:uncharacterized protein LOC116162693 n=1 Tax=Photinus pyralis TaxID=7054 RepID=UPI00126755F6|nr:uncharacterized protein LOC116162693 [Photinus pyralis]XP_031332230.1 uncharacterized protein LOC116162693 [Photinus pyralis]XP_031332232.1 uncharacterized protein LOC116162693 [Photinus pyralis]XP_031355396.1 uncharacterized protein LOC116179716 [Photinus pyralis]XP_031355397.1 uncharacterized protein LOC116179716 [Photinus pyralis]XP_031355398.1 uncharacterized protein LOC116179716 [Photinus pyralis]